MKLQAVHTIIRRPTKGKEVVHAPGDSQKGVFECPEEEGRTYLDAGAALLLEDGPQKPARKQAKPKGKKETVVDPAAVPGQSGETGADDDSAGGTNSDAEGGSDEDLMG